MMALALVIGCFIINASPELQALQFSDFPNAHFNHMMVCVPDARDTIWLECTSQSLQFGYLSDFTDARLALVVTPDGGRLWKTSSYSPDQNKSIRQTSVKLGADGAATVQTSERASCQMQDRLLFLAELSEEEQKKLLYHYLKLKDFEIKSIKTQKEVDSLATSVQSLELVMPNYATRSGKRLFYRPLSLFMRSKPQRICQIAPSKFRLTHGVTQ